MPGLLYCFEKSRRALVCRREGVPRDGHQTAAGLQQAVSLHDVLGPRCARVLAATRPRRRERRVHHHDFRAIGPIWAEDVRDLLGVLCGHTLKSEAFKRWNATASDFVHKDAGTCVLGEYRNPTVPCTGLQHPVSLARSGNPVCHVGIGRRCGELLKCVRLHVAARLGGQRVHQFREALNRGLGPRCVPGWVVCRLLRVLVGNREVDRQL